MKSFFFFKIGNSHRRFYFIQCLSCYISSALTSFFKNRVDLAHILCKLKVVFHESVLIHDLKFLKDIVWSLHHQVHHVDNVLSFLQFQLHLLDGQIHPGNEIPYCLRFSWILYFIMIRISIHTHHFFL